MRTRNIQTGRFTGTQLHKQHPRLYAVWNRMKDRCDNPKAINYPHYGGRGISYDKGWSNAENFITDMLPTYKPGLTLDRIDNNKGYFKENCRWADRFIQANNTRNNNRIEYKGKNHTIAEWSKLLGIKYNTLWNRVMTYNWSVEKAFNPELSQGRKP